MKYLEAMQIEVTNAFNKPRNISLPIVDAEKYKQNNVSLFGPTNIICCNILTQKYWNILPICPCTECPPGVLEQRSSKLRYATDPTKGTTLLNATSENWALLRGPKLGSEYVTFALLALIVVLAAGPDHRSDVSARK